MALKPCVECGREVSTDARVRPSCGKRSPTMGPMAQFVRGIAVLAIVVLVLKFGMKVF